MERPSKRSNLIFSDQIEPKDYQVALDKDVRNLFIYTNTLPTGSGLGDGTSIGDIIYWNGSVWTLLHPGTYGQVLVTAGTGYPPFWDWVYYSPGAQASDERFVYLNFGNPILSVDLIIMNRLINQEATMTASGNSDVTPTDVSFTETAEGDIISMNVTINNIATITLTQNGTVA